jgi:LDH2 family malate/lactate/ureidoglycolate dehydrogenase
MSGSIQADVGEVTNFVTNLFAAAGLENEAAQRVSVALVEADLSGRGSHGVLQANGYLGRLIAGTMSTASNPIIVSERGGTVVMDAADIEGHLAAEEAMNIAVTKAREFGVSAVSVRRAFHCGVAGRYVRMAAEQGCAAFAMCNTKPVMAAPGGAERLVGTNPIAIGFPVRDETPVVLDMATTAGTIGGIRQKLAAGQTLPETWALDGDGNPTIDATAALDGFLLPTGGAKGFGLSFVIDLLCGALASGGWGPTLGEMNGDKPFNASFLFIALDIEHFRPFEEFLNEARAGVERVRNSTMATGTDRLVVPGERSAEAIATNTGTIPLTPMVAKGLVARAETLNVPLPSFLS